MKELAAQGLEYFTSAPVRLFCHASFTAPPDAVFAKLTEPASWPTWFPMMTSAAWVGEPVATVGADRDVALTGLGRFRERIIAWEPGKRFAFTMVRSSSPFASAMAEDYKLKATATGTELDWVMAVTPTAIGKLAVPGLRIVMRNMFERAGKRLNEQLMSRG